MDSAKLNIISPVESLQEKEKNDSLRVTQGCKVVKLWPINVCRNPGKNNNAYRQMEFLAISVVNILSFTGLFPTKTKMSHFTHILMFFSQCDQFLSKYDTKISRLLSLQRNA